MTRRALVTGVVGGIGAAIARQLAQAGHEVVVTDLPGEPLRSAALALGLRAEPCDLGDVFLAHLRSQLVEDYFTQSVFIRENFSHLLTLLRLSC